MRIPKRQANPVRVLTGNCPIREHTGDGAYVGRCEFACYDGVCPRHGRVSMYADMDDREVAVGDRSFVPMDAAPITSTGPHESDPRKEPS